MATKTGICNAAIIAVGEERISDITENNKRAIACNERYDKLRKALLKAHPWNFALERVELAVTATEPEFGYAYAYQLPTDCLRVLRINGDYEYKIEGKLLLTDYSDVKILYIKDVTDPGLFSDDFAECLGAFLAWKICYHLTNSRTLTQDLKSDFNEMLREVRTMDAQEGTPDAIEASDWINARF